MPMSKKNILKSVHVCFCYKRVVGKHSIDRVQAELAAAGVDVSSEEIVTQLKTFAQIVDNGSQLFFKQRPRNLGVPKPIVRMVEIGTLNIPNEDKVSRGMLLLSAMELYIQVQK